MRSFFDEDSLPAKNSNGSVDFIHFFDEAAIFSLGSGGEEGDAGLGDAFVQGILFLPKIIPNLINILLSEANSPLRLFIQLNLLKNLLLLLLRLFFELYQIIRQMASFYHCFLLFDILFNIFLQLL